MSFEFTNETHFFADSSRYTVIYFQMFPTVHTDDKSGSLLGFNHSRQ